MSIKPLTAALILGGVVATAGTCYLFRKRLNLDKVFEELSQIAKKRGAQISAGVATVGAAGCAIANNKLNNIKGQVAEKINNFFLHLRHNQNGGDGDGGADGGGGGGGADGAGASRAAAFADADARPRIPNAGAPAAQTDAGRAAAFASPSAETPQMARPNTEAESNAPTPVNPNGNNRDETQRLLEEAAAALRSGINETTRAVVGGVEEVQQIAVGAVEELGNRTRNLLDQGADTVGAVQQAIENPGDLVASEARRLTNVALRKLRKACLYTVGTAGAVYLMYKSTTMLTSHGSEDQSGMSPNMTGPGF